MTDLLIGATRSPMFDEPCIIDKTSVLPTPATAEQFHNATSSLPKRKHMHDSISVPDQISPSSHEAHCATTTGPAVLAQPVLPEAVGNQKMHTPEADTISPTTTSHTKARKKLIFSLPAEVSTQTSVVPLAPALLLDQSPQETTLPPLTTVPQTPTPHLAVQPPLPILLRQVKKEKGDCDMFAL